MCTDDYLQFGFSPECSASLAFSSGLRASLAVWPAAELHVVPRSPAHPVSLRRGVGGLEGFLSSV